MCVLEEIKAKILEFTRKIIESDIILSLVYKIKNLLVQYKVIKTFNAITEWILESRVFLATNEKLQNTILRYKLLGVSLTPQDVLVIGIIVLFWYLIFHIVFSLFNGKNSK
jgi:hypothetical protein